MRSALSGLAAAAVYAAGRPRFGAALAALSIVHHGLVYALGERLVKPDRRHVGCERPDEPADSECP